MKIRLGRYELRPAARQLLVDGIDTAIGGRAFDLLLALVERHDRVVSAEELVDLVWPDVSVEPNNLQVQIWALRRLLGRDSIATVARRGYRLAVPAAAVPEPAGDARVVLNPLGESRRSGVVDVPHDHLAGPCEELAWRIRRHRIVTLTGGDLATRRLLLERVARTLLTSVRGGVWRLEANAVADLLGGASSRQSCVAPVRGPSIARLGRQESVLVLFEADAMAPHDLPRLSRELTQAPLVRLLTSSSAPLGLPHEEIVDLPGQARCVLGIEGMSGTAEASGSVPASADSRRSALRWHPRGG